MFLTSSAIIGFLRLYRHFIHSSITKEDEIKKRLETITVNFKRDKYEFPGSRWAKLEEVMFENIREKFPDFGGIDLIKRR